MANSIQNQITEALRAIEQEHQVRILMAVESGSRAWGFASPDSDYDVRFVYVHQPDWYFGVNERRDVIENMLPNDLDMSGWELRKTLRLMSKCNCALNEWIGSPVRYFDEPAFKAALEQTAPRYFNPIAALHHYRASASSALTGHLQGNQISIKKLFYVLRPLLACLWIANTRTQPPTAFADLLAPEWSNELDKHWIAELQKQKAVAVEATPFELPNDKIDLLNELLSRFSDAPSVVSAASIAPTDELNGLLKEWIRSQSNRSCQ